MMAGTAYCISSDPIGLVPSSRVLSCVIFQIFRHKVNEKFALKLLYSRKSITFVATFL